MMETTLNEDDRILILASHPHDIMCQHAETEVREIGAALRSQHSSRRLVLEYRTASRPRDMHRALLEFQPTIVHLCGDARHADPGSPDTLASGLVMEDDRGRSFTVHAKPLAELFALFAREVRCVLLNHCASQELIDAMAAHLDYVIGATTESAADAAVEFAVPFYRALTAGRSIPFAHQFGCVAMKMAHYSELDLPVLVGQKVEESLHDPRRHHMSPATGPEPASHPPPGICH